MCLRWGDDASVAFGGGLHVCALCPRDLLVCVTTALHIVCLWLASGLLVTTLGVECQLNLSYSILNFLHVPYVACSSIRWKELPTRHVQNKRCALLGF